MSDKPEKVYLQFVNRWVVKPTDDGKHMAIVFDMQDGPVGVALDNNNLGLFIEGILQELAKLTATQTPEYPPKELVAAPVPVTSFGFAPDPRDSSSTVLMVVVGNVRISFQVDATMLQTTCERVVASAKELRPKTAN